MAAFTASTLRRRALLGGVVAWLAVAQVACSKPPELARVEAGASVTYGTGVAPGQDWPTLLAAATGWNIHNAGVPGDTAAQGKHRLPGLLAEHQPRLVLIEIGGNDFLKRTPEATVKEDLRQMVRTARASGAQVAAPALSLLAVVAKKPSDAALYAEPGREEGVPVIADVFSSTLADAALRSGPAHPNATGYLRMADDIRAVLARLGAL